MAKVFLDANYFIDVVHRKPEAHILNQVTNHALFVSPLSFHIYCYIFKIKIPNDDLFETLKRFNLVKINLYLVQLALTGPTRDFEDNVQLHSSARAECEFFLTSDAKLLKLTYFGKARIVNAL